MWSTMTDNKKSAWEKYKEKNGVTPLDMLNPKTIKTSDEKQKARFSLCLSCENLTKHTHQCKLCGCFMSAKTKLEDAKCPIGKW